MGHVRLPIPVAFLLALPVALLRAGVGHARPTRLMSL
jgi:hypothetical protein